MVTSTHPVGEPVWRAPSTHERELVTRWLEAWNTHAGDTAEFPAEGQAANSCGCGTCPTFVAMPIALSIPDDHEGPLAIEGNLFSDAGKALAMVLVFRTSNGIEVEVAPLVDDGVTLEGTSSTFFPAP